MMVDEAYQFKASVSKGLMVNTDVALCSIEDGYEG